MEMVCEICLRPFKLATLASPWAYSTSRWPHYSTQSSDILTFESVTLGKCPLDTLKFFNENYKVISSVKELSKAQKRQAREKAIFKSSMHPPIKDC